MQFDKIGTIVVHKKNKNTGFIHEIEKRGPPRPGFPPRDIIHITWSNGRTGWFWQHNAHKKLAVLVKV